MKAVILCGGMGTRLREETEFRPKPLVEIGGKPILWHIMKTYAHYGIKEFVLCLGYKGNLIKEYFLNYRVMQSDFTLRLDSPAHPQYHCGIDPVDWSITFAETGAEAMTGARVKRIAKYIGEDTFFLTYGDGVADIDIGKLLEFHRRHGKIGTVTGVRSNSQFGEMVVMEGRVDRFSEKPPSEESYISGGYFVFDRRFFDYLSEDDNCVLEREPIEKLSRDGQLMGYLHPGYWYCMDTYRDFVALNELWRQGAPWKIWD